MSRTLTISAMLVTLAALGVLAVVLIGRGQQAEPLRGSEGGASQGREPGSRVESNAVRGANAGRTGCGPDAPVDNLTVDMSFDAADETRLVSASDNVFVGRVMGQVEDVPLPEAQPLPTTSFAVRVEENIKGLLSGTVTLVQGGGCDPKYGRVAIINNDALLKPGQEALFTTHLDKDVPGEVHSLVSFQFSSVGLESASERARVLAKFQEAKRRAASVRSGRTVSGN